MSHGASEVSFKNDYGLTIYVAYIRRDPDCKADGGQPWEVRGWIELPPGATKYRENATEHQWFYYYAEAPSDGAFWPGPYVEFVTIQKFKRCLGVGSQ